MQSIPSSPTFFPLQQSSRQYARGEWTSAVSAMNKWVEKRKWIKPEIDFVQSAICSAWLWRWRELRCSTQCSGPCWERNLLRSRRINKLTTVPEPSGEFRPPYIRDRPVSVWTWRMYILIIPKRDWNWPNHRHSISLQLSVVRPDRGLRILQALKISIEWEERWILQYLLHCHLLNFLYICEMTADALTRTRVHSNIDGGNPSIFLVTCCAEPRHLKRRHQSNLSIPTHLQIRISSSEPVPFESHEGVDIRRLRRTEQRRELLQLLKVTLAVKLMSKVTWICLSNTWGNSEWFATPKSTVSSFLLLFPPIDPSEEKKINQ